MSLRSAGVGSSVAPMGVDDAAGPTVARSVRVSTRSGRVEVVAEDRDDVLVVDGARHVQPTDDATRLTVSSRSDRVVLRVPRGTDVVVGTTSGRVDLRGDLGVVAVTTRSGRVEVESARRASLRTTSGRVEVGECHESARVATVSGRVEVRRTGEVKVATTTGRVVVHDARGEVGVRSVAGKITIAVSTSPVAVRLESFSGRVELSVPPGSRPRQRYSSRSGSIRSSVGIGGDGRISARTTSGSIVVTEA